MREATLAAAAATLLHYTLGLGNKLLKMLLETLQLGFERIHLDFRFLTGGFRINIRDWQHLSFLKLFRQQGKKQRTINKRENEK